ncbi:hypothetical protein E3Q24_01024 [Wallemia mellicola]|nr:hypothetical protein E3Q24_01024 [Wallemia mellicola]
MSDRPTKKQRLVKSLEVNVVYTIMPSSTTFMSRTMSTVEVEVVQNNYGDFGRCSLRECLTQACITSPELLGDYTLHAMNAYESEKLVASGVDTQPVFAIEGTVQKCLSDNKKLIIGNLETGDPFDDDSDVLRVVLRFQRNSSETPKQYLPKASSSKSNKRRAPSTPPSRRVSSSQVKKEKEEKKAEKYPEVCITCGTKETSTWRFVSDPSSSSGRARACNSCGLYWKKNNSMRPETLWKNGEEDKAKISRSRKMTDENVTSGDGSPVRRSFSVSLSQQQNRRDKSNKVLGDLNNNNLNHRQKIPSLKAPPRKEAEAGFKIPRGPYTSPPRKTAYNNEYLQDILNSSPGTMLKHVFSEGDKSPEGTFSVNGKKKPSSRLKLAISEEEEEEEDVDQTIRNTTFESKNTPFDFNTLPPSSPPNMVSPYMKGNKEEEDELDELASSPADRIDSKKQYNLDELVRMLNNKESPFIVESPPSELYPI